MVGDEDHPAVLDHRVGVRGGWLRALRTVGSLIARPAIPGGPWLVVGLARSGIAAAELLIGRGETVLGVDRGTPALPGGFPAVTGTDGLAELDQIGARAVVVSPGVPWNSPVVAEARRRGLAVMGELELGWRASRGRVLAITGTNGKTTTSELLAAICRDAGLHTVLAGNVGTALTALAPSTTIATTMVLEVSSFQLESSDGFAP